MEVMQKCLMVKGKNGDYTQVVMMILQPTELDLKRYLSIGANVPRVYAGWDD